MPVGALHVGPCPASSPTLRFAAGAWGFVPMLCRPEKESPVSSAFFTVPHTKPNAGELHQIGEPSMQHVMRRELDGVFLQDAASPAWPCL